MADASHELRTPLAVVHTRAQMVRRHLSADATPRQRAELDQLVADTESLGEVVSDLLLAAQLEHTQLAPRRVDLAELAEEVGASMRPYAEQAGVRLDVAAEGDWSGGTGRERCADSAATRADGVGGQRDRPLELWRCGLHPASGRRRCDRSPKAGEWT